MAAESNSSMGERQLWSSWAANQGWKYLDSEDDKKADNGSTSKKSELKGEDDKKADNGSTSEKSEHKEETEGNKNYSVSMKLPRKDITIYGLHPADDELVLVVCTVCESIVKKENFVYHFVNHHKEVDTNSDETPNQLSKSSDPNLLASNKSVSSQSAKTALNSCTGTSNNYTRGASKTTSSSPATRQCASYDLGAIAGSTPLDSCDRGFSNFSSMQSSSVHCLQSATLSSNGQPSNPCILKTIPMDVSSVTKPNKKTVRRKGKTAKKSYDVTLAHCPQLRHTDKESSASQGYSIASQNIVPNHLKDLSEVGKELPLKKKQKTSNVNPVAMDCHVQPGNSVGTSVPQVIRKEGPNKTNSAFPLSLSTYSAIKVGASSERSHAFGGDANVLNSREEVYSMVLPKQQNNILRHKRDVPLPTNASVTSLKRNSEVHNNRLWGNSTIITTTTTSSPWPLPVPAAPVVAIATPVTTVSSNINATAGSTIPPKLNANPNVQINGVVCGLPTLKDILECDLVKESNSRTSNSGSTPLQVKRCPKPVALCTFGLRAIDQGVYSTRPKLKHIHDAVRSVAEKISIARLQPDPNLTEKQAKNRVSNYVSSSDVDNNIPSSFLSPTTTVATVSVKTAVRNCVNVNNSTYAKQPSVCFPFSNWDLQVENNKPKSGVSNCSKGKRTEPRKYEAGNLTVHQTISDGSTNPSNILPYYGFSLNRQQFGNVGLELTGNQDHPQPQVPGTPNFRPQVFSASSSQHFSLINNNTNHDNSRLSFTRVVYPGTVPDSIHGLISTAAPCVSNGTEYPNSPKNNSVSECPSNSAHSSRRSVGSPSSSSSQTARRRLERILPTY